MTQSNHNKKVVELFLSLVEQDIVSHSEELLDIAAANKIKYPYLRYLSDSETSDHIVENKIFEMKSSQQAFENDLQSVGRMLSEMGVSYAFIKTLFPFTYRGWDLNLLVSPADKDAVIQRFKREGWYRSTFREHPIARTEPKKVMLEHETRTPIHVHDAVGWNGVEYISAKPVLESVREINGVRYPSESMDWLIHCAHSVFENYELTVGEAYLLREYERASQAVISEYRLADAVEIADRYTDAIHRGNWFHTPPIVYTYPELLSAWRKHSHNISGLWELGSHHAFYTIKILS